jgi:hypothetical protein
MILCDDGGNVVLRLHDEDDASAAAVLSPVDAIGLAGELVAAAYRRPAA